MNEKKTEIFFTFFLLSQYYLLSLQPKPNH